MAAPRAPSLASLVGGPEGERLRLRREAASRRVLSALCDADVAGLFGSGLEARPAGALDEALGSALDPLVSSGELHWWGDPLVVLTGIPEAGEEVEPVLELSVSLPREGPAGEMPVPPAPFGLRMGVRQLHPGMGDVLDVMLG